MTVIQKEAKVIIFYFLEYLRLIPNNYSWELWVQNSQGSYFLFHQFFMQ